MSTTVINQLIVGYLIDSESCDIGTRTFRNNLLGIRRMLNAQCICEPVRRIGDRLYVAACGQYASRDGKRLSATVKGQEDLRGNVLIVRYLDDGSYGSLDHDDIEAIEDRIKQRYVRSNGGHYNAYVLDFDDIYYIDDDKTDLRERDYKGA